MDSHHFDSVVLRRGVKFNLNNTDFEVCWISWHIFMNTGEIVFQKHLT